MLTATPAIELPVGSVFADRYRIEGPLGQGGMGVVYRAADLYLAEDVALKLLLVELAQSPALALRFRQEVRLSRRVNHPNVIRVHDLGEQQGLLYMTMELIAGQTLRDLINSHRGGVPLDQSLWIARAVTEGLRAAHAAAIIHRDIKPSNVLLDVSGRVVLTDFGIARCVDEDLGLTSGLLGTMSYMAPEQAANGHIDARTDLYALATVVLEMLLGARPAGGVAEIADQIARARPTLPEALAKVLLRCLAIDPAARPSGTAEILDAITAASTGLVADAASAATIVEHAAPPRGLTAPAPTPTPPPQNKLAVLPFRFRGPGEQGYLGEVLTDELVDALSRTRGLFVLGSGATARFGESRDPIAMGRELKVHGVIDGSVQAVGDRVRVVVRLLDAETGVQRWVQQREGTLSDVFTFQESVVRRVAEELRLELHTMAHARTVPTVALDHYVEARKDMRALGFPASAHAVELLDGALALSPTFAPAIAARAVASVRCWFLDLGDDGRDWAKLADASVARAMAEAPEIAESHLAAAMLATQRGEYRTASSALMRTLDIAPTCAPAHEYLGILQAEAGQMQKGLEHLRLAVELDPSRVVCWGTLAQVLSLLGDEAGYEAALRSLDTMDRPDRFSFSTSVRIRHTAWLRDLGRLRALVEGNFALEGHSAGRLVILYARSMLGEIDAAELARCASAHESTMSRRMRSFILQLSAEVFAARGQPELALRQIALAASSVLVDVTWLDRCPLLADLHGAPELLEAQRLVRARAREIWTS